MAGACRIKVEFGSDGSLESRLYLSRAGRGDTGRYSCAMPGLDSVAPALLNITTTQGKISIALVSNGSMMLIFKQAMRDQHFVSLPYPKTSTDKH